ncbi:MAG: hypothetical protein ACC682_12930 [Gemmatimonadota bacterium]
MRTTVFCLSLLAFPQGLAAQRAGDLRLVNETGATLEVWAESGNGELLASESIRPGQSFHSLGSMTYGEEWNICLQPKFIEDIKPFCWIVEPVRGQRVYSWDIFDDEFVTTAGRPVTVLLDPPSADPDPSPFEGFDQSDFAAREEFVRMELAARCPGDDLEYKFRELRGVIPNGESNYPHCYESECWEEGRKTLLFGDTERVYETPPAYWTYDGENLYLWGQRDEGSEGVREWVGCP